MSCERKMSVWWMESSDDRFPSPAIDHKNHLQGLPWDIDLTCDKSISVHRLELIKFTPIYDSGNNLKEDYVINGRLESGCVGRSTTYGRKKKPRSLPGGGGGALKNVLYGEAPPQGPTPYPFTCHY